jgi:predicted secreted protein
MANYNDYLTYGGDLMVFISSGATKEAIAFSTSAKMSISMKTRDVSSKDSGNFTEKKAGKYDWNMSTDALCNFSTTGTTMSVDDLYNYFIAGILVNVGFGSKTGTSPSWTMNAAAKNFTGTALITSMDLNSGDGETATYSIQLEGSGPLVLA